MDDKRITNLVSPPPSVGDFLKGKPCLRFQPDEPISMIIEKMRDHHTYAVAIVDNDKLVGLLTGQDILIRATSWQRQRTPSMESIARAFNAMKAADVMIRKPLTVLHQTSLGEAMAVMRESGFRYLPVTKNEYPIGILNILDVMKYMEEKIRRDNETKDEILSYMMNHENYGCVSKE